MNRKNKINIYKGYNTCAHMYTYGTRNLKE